jgi:hypothetical protein
MLNKKDYIFFLLGLALFSIIIIYSGIIYLRWNSEIDDEELVEINLPVVDWDSYFSLSKQPK